MVTLVPYEVRNRASGARYYVIADSAEHAVERVTLALADPGGVEAWEAFPASPALTLVAEVVFDESGRPIKSPMG